MQDHLTRQFVAFLIVGFGTLLAMPRAAAAHPFHVSVAEAEYNAKKKCLEVALRLHPVDLEQALRRQSGKQIDLDQTPDVDAHIKKYLSKRFHVRSRQGRAVRLEWVGKEVSRKWAWLYFQVPLPDGLPEIQFRNEMLFDVVTDQVNTINFRDARRRVTLNFQHDRPQQIYPPADDVLHSTR